MDTESTTDGYLSAFMANKFKSRLKVKIPNPKKADKPSRKYEKGKFQLFKLLENVPDKIRLTQQKEVKAFFDYLNNVCTDAEVFYKDMAQKADKLKCYIVIHFANLTWDLDILKGIIFNDNY